MHDIVKAARNVAIKTNLTAFYIFADKIEFAKAMAAILRINEKWQPNERPLPCDPVLIPSLPPSHSKKRKRDESLQI
ncbi:hypothetical protein OSTOST_05539 [Ostertagia ostertagi]